MPTESENIIAFPKRNYHRHPEIPNFERYSDFLLPIAATPAAQRKLLEALWLLMNGIVEFSHGQHPIQHPDVTDDLEGLDDLDAAILRAVDDFAAKAA